jgi:DNA-binding NarL/FixJ family response regulator
VVRHGLRALLESQPGWVVVDEAAHGREAVQKAEQEKPDVVILDLSMPELNGLEATRQILKAMPQTEVLILTVHESEQVVKEVLKAGARGYVLKSDAGRDLVAAVQALSQHQTFFTSKVAEMVLAGYLRRDAPAPEEAGPRLPLSSREREVIQLLAEGKSNKEVAKVLHLSVKTVETHRAKIMHKLDLHSIGDLIRYALRHNIAASQPSTQSPTRHSPRKIPAFAYSALYSRGVILSYVYPGKPRNGGGSCSDLLGLTPKVRLAAIEKGVRCAPASTPCIKQKIWGEF